MKAAPKNIPTKVRLNIMKEKVELLGAKHRSFLKAHDELLDAFSEIGCTDASAFKEREPGELKRELDFELGLKALLGEGLLRRLGDNSEFLLYLLNERSVRDKFPSVMDDLF